MLSQLLFSTIFSLTPFCLAQSSPTDSSYYGQSPAVEPPIANGLGPWASAYSKARDLVAQLSLEEKVNLTGGVTSPRNGCSGNIPVLERAGFPGLCLNDAGQGVRATDFVSGFASGISVGASWNRDLAHARAVALGAEFRKKGVNMALGPAVGAIGRIVTGGRNWESFSVDPYLCGALAYQTVHGMQSNGVITTTKHLIANEQELNRLPTRNSENQTVESSSSNIDDKTMHEIYLWPFQDAVHAGTAAIMCSFQRLNNSYGCQNSKSQNGLLKTELGFQGFVVSDWGAQHAGVASAVSGLDMAMPSGLRYWAGNLTQAVRNGSVSEARMDDIATRIMAAWYHLGQDDGGFSVPGFGIPKLLNTTHDIVDARDPDARETILQSAVESHVLVKNTGNALPLRSPKLLSLYGYSSRSAQTNNPAPSGFSDWSMGTTGTNVESITCGFGFPGNCPPVPGIAVNGTLISGGGSGAVTPSYISAPHDAILQYAAEKGVALFWDYENVNATANFYGMTDACLVFINAWATEGTDRPHLRDEYSDSLVNNIADQCQNTIVVLHNAGIRIVDSFYDHPNVTGIIYAHLPGQDSGAALVKVLFGEISPSGKLPYTVAKSEGDYGDVLYHYQTDSEAEDALFPQDDFEEGALLDYRAFDANGIEPRFEFGFGLSYSTFAFGSLQVSTTGGVVETYPTGEIMPGGRSDLWDVVVRVSCEVTNAGEVEAAEVAQLYLTIPGMVKNIESQSEVVGRQLRGFEKASVTPGMTVTLEFELTRRDVSVWDVVAQEWAINRGIYVVEVGSSSRKLPLRADFTIQ